MNRVGFESEFSTESIKRHYVSKRNYVPPAVLISAYEATFTSAEINLLLHVEAGEYALAWGNNLDVTQKELLHVGT